MSLILIPYIIRICLLLLQIPLPWTMSPVKMTSSAPAASFLDMTFDSDQDDDDEYNPELDDAVCITNEGSVMWFLCPAHIDRFLS